MSWIVLLHTMLIELHNYFVNLAYFYLYSWLCQNRSKFKEKIINLVLSKSLTNRKFCFCQSLFLLKYGGTRVINQV